MTTLARAAHGALEKDGVRITREPDGRLLVLAGAGHFYLDADDVAQMLALLLKGKGENA